MLRKKHWSSNQEVSRLLCFCTHIGGRSSLLVARGSTAREFYLQAYQYILWKQSHALIHTICLPKAIESILRDLWALRLQRLTDKVEDKLALTDELYSSQQADAATTDLDREIQDPIRRASMPTLLETLGLCYLAIITLRLPVSMGDVHRWAVREDIPYFRAIRCVPGDLRQKLPAESHRSLDTSTPLRADDVRRVVHRLGLFYMREFKISFPPLNYHLLLYRFVRELALPGKPCSVNASSSVNKISRRSFCCLLFVFHFVHELCTFQS